MTAIPEATFEPSRMPIVITTKAGTTLLRKMSSKLMPPVSVSTISVVAALDAHQ